MIIEKKCPFNSYTFACAAGNKNIKIIKQLFELGCPRSTYAFDFAVKCECLKNMKWLLEKEFTYNKTTQ